MLQVGQLSADVEAVREQVAAKNREQLKLQEDVLSLEEQLREAVSKNKHATDALNIEEQHREKLELRYCGCNVSLDNLIRCLDKI